MQKNYLSILTILVLTFTVQLEVYGQTYAVGQSNFQFSDPSRSGGLFGGQRDVDADIYYPATAAGTDTPIASGEFPLIIFGHGFGMNYTEYEVWWDSLVTCGYIMIFPQTEGAVFPFPSHENFALDFIFLAETFIDETTNNPGSPYYQSWNGKTAVMGHSMGGGCSYLAAEGTTLFNTLVSLAAADTDPSSVAAAANLTVPSLTVAGSADCVVTAGGAPIDHYNNAATAPYKAFVDIIDGMHCQFGIVSTGSVCTLGESCSGMPKADQHTYMVATVKPWLEYYLKEDCQGWLNFVDYTATYNGDRHNFQEAGTGANCSACTDIVNLNDPAIPSGSYEAAQVIYSSGQISSGAIVGYYAGDSIVLNPGFEVPLNTDFEAITGAGCQ